MITTLMQWYGKTIRFFKQEEYDKCKNDPVYFIREYLKFNLCSFQKDIIINIHREQKSLIATCRQAGKTSICIHYLVYLWAFEPTKSVYYQGHRFNSAYDRDIIQSAKELYKSLPLWLREQCKPECNKNPDEADILILDEWAYTEIRSSTITATYLSLNNKKVITISTPCRESNFDIISFNPDLYGFKVLRFDYTNLPWLDEYNKEELIKTIGLENFVREYVYNLRTYNEEQLKQIELAYDVANENDPLRELDYYSWFIKNGSERFDMLKSILESEELRPKNKKFQPSLIVGEITYATIGGRTYIKNKNNQGVYYMGEDTDTNTHITIGDKTYFKDSILSNYYIRKDKDINLDELKENKND